MGHLVIYDINLYFLNLSVYLFIPPSPSVSHVSVRVSVYQYGHLARIDHVNKIQLYQKARMYVHPSLAHVINIILEKRYTEEN